MPAQPGRQVRREPRPADDRGRAPPREELLHEVAGRLRGHDAIIDEAAQRRERARRSGADEGVATVRVEQAPAERVQQRRVPVGALGLEHERVRAARQARAERGEVLERRRIGVEQRLVHVERAALEREREPVERGTDAQRVEVRGLVLEALADAERVERLDESALDVRDDAFMRIDE